MLSFQGILFHCFIGILFWRLSQAQTDTICTRATGDESHCICSTDKGVIDVTSLGNSDKTPKFTNLIGEENANFKYDLNICYGFTGTDLCTNAAPCQDTGHHNYNCGNISTGQFYYDGETAYLQYTGGIQDRISQINLKCDPQKEDPVVIAKGDTYERQLFYEYTITHKCACPGVYSGGGIPPGEIGISFICLIIVAVILYFIIGAVVMAAKYGKKGTDAIPNKNFWLGLPLLLKDGFMLVFGPLIGIIKNKRSGANTYSQL